MTTHVTQHTQSGQEKIQWRLSPFFDFFLPTLELKSCCCWPLRAATLRFIAGTLHNWGARRARNYFGKLSGQAVLCSALLCTQHRFSFLPINNSKRHSRIPFHVPCPRHSACHLFAFMSAIRNSCAAIYQSLFPSPLCPSLLLLLHLFWCWFCVICAWIKRLSMRCGRSSCRGHLSRIYIH